VVITDVYPAGEAPIPGIGGKELADGIRTRGHRDVRHIVGEADLAETVASLALPGDVVVCMGAGSISAWANALPKRLEGGAP
jgi:UDP-N-acetylmuramate--alanine ligase